MQSKIEKLMEQKKKLENELELLNKSVKELQSQCKHTGRKVFHPSNGPYIDGFSVCVNCGKVV